MTISSTVRPRRSFLLALLAAVLGSIPGCDAVTAPERPPAGIRLGEAALELTEGDSIRLEVQVVDEEGVAIDGATVEIAWTSSDTSVATVRNGLIRALGAGDVEITASVGEVRATAQVAVVPVPTGAAAVSGDSQRGLVSTRLPDTLTVRVTDRRGGRAAGVAVVWAATGGNVTPLRVVTDSLGEASAIWTLAAQTGTYTATATAGSVSATFSAEAEEPTSADLRLELVADGLAPFVAHVAAPAGDERLFIVGIDGVIRILREGRVLAEPFLDLRDRVARFGEMGLFSVAFHPDFAANGHLYVNYVDRESRLRVDRYTAAPAADRASADTGKPILVMAPATHHFGGSLAFGPDRKLYLSVGDQGKPDSAQSPASLVGKLVRIDVDAGDPYAIPSDNPYRGAAGARGEVWAVGLRNPFRASIDPEAGLIYIGDVGENRWEEINIVPTGSPGHNFGWPHFEGPDCLAEEAEICVGRPVTAPALAYSRGIGPDHPSGCSVAGGAVYRGARMPWLQGRYFYADFCGGWIQSLVYREGRATEVGRFHLQAPGSVISFGQDGWGELYVTTMDGELYRVVPAR